MVKPEVPMVLAEHPKDSVLRAMMWAGIVHVA